MLQKLINVIRTLKGPISLTDLSHIIGTDTNTTKALLDQLVLMKKIEIKQTLPAENCTSKKCSLCPSLNSCNSSLGQSYSIIKK